MQKSTIIILSGSCCNPSLKSMDTKIESVLKEAASAVGVEATIKTISIASVAFGGAGVFGDKLGPEIRSLIKEKGIGVLPLIIINGEIKYSSTVPTFEEICQQFK